MPLARMVGSLVVLATLAGCGGAALSTVSPTDPTDDNLDQHTRESRAAIAETCAHDSDCRGGAVCESGACVSKNAR